MTTSLPTYPWQVELPETMPTFAYADFGAPGNRKPHVEPGLYNLMTAHMDKLDTIKERCIAQGVDTDVYEQSHQALVREVHIEGERMTVHDALSSIRAHADAAVRAIARLTNELADEDTGDASTQVAYVKAFLEVLLTESKQARSQWPFDENGSSK